MSAYLFVIVITSYSIHYTKLYDVMVGIRKSKGLAKEKALAMLNDPLVFAPMMIKCGDADGEVAGAINATGDVITSYSIHYTKLYDCQACGSKSGRYT